MSTTETVHALQRALADAEVERLRLVAQKQHLLDVLRGVVEDFPDMRERPESVLRADLILEAQDRARAVLARGER